MRDDYVPLASRPCHALVRARYVAEMTVLERRAQRVFMLLVQHELTETWSSFFADAFNNTVVVKMNEEDR